VTKTCSTPTRPSLRDLALDHLGHLAAELRKSDPTLTREAAVRTAAQSTEGREAYNLYRMTGSEKPWDQAITAIVKRELVKGEGGAGTMRAAILAKAAGKKTDLKRKAPTNPPPTNDPADAIYGHIREQAVAANPKMSEPAAVATFLQTPAGRQLWATYNAARRQVDD